MTKVLYRNSRLPDDPAVTFREALLRGLAPGAGLYLPERIPALPNDWRSVDSFASLATLVLEPWLEAPLGKPLGSLLAEALDFPVPL
ncbi:MAG: threonine synthase, partial [Trueperaceae bacterium]